MGQSFNYKLNMYVTNTFAKEPAYYMQCLLIPHTANKIKTMH